MGKLSKLKFEDPAEELEFSRWLASLDKFQTTVVSRIGSVILLLWIFVVAPLWIPEVAWTIPTMMIHVGLVAIYFVWVFHGKIAYLQNRKEASLTIGTSMVMGLYVCLLCQFELPDTLQHASVFLNTIYLFGFLTNYSRLKYQVLYAFSVGLFIQLGINHLQFGSAFAFPSGIDIIWRLIVAFFGIAIVGVKEISLRRNFSLERDLVEANLKSDRLIRNILPEQIILEMESDNCEVSSYHENVTILFADLIGFTELSRKTPASTVVKYLDELFGKFDTLCLKFGIEKIKTIGDAYMAASGVPSASKDHATKMLHFSFELLAEVKRFKEAKNIEIGVRIGVHSGPVIAGVIGKTKYCYDIWGDTVNLASRLESASKSNHILISRETKSILPDRFEWSDVSTKDLKGIGDVECGYILDRRDQDRGLPE